MSRPLWETQISNQLVLTDEMGEQGKQFVLKFTSGAVSATLSTTLFQPLDLLKTRFQLGAFAANVPGWGAQNVGIARTVSSVVRRDTVRGLWKGTTPSLARCIPGIGLYFASIDTLETLYGKPSGQLAMHETLIMGFAARSLVTACMMPASVIKTRYESGRYSYSTVLQAGRETLTKEGLKGLYRGSQATLLRDAPFSGLFYMFYRKSKEIVASHSTYHQLTPIHNLTCGVVAGMLASIITQPADVIKTHQQVEATRVRGTLEVVRGVIARNGVQGLFAGTTRIGR